MKTIKRVKLCLIAFFAVVFASMTLTLAATNVKRADAAAALDTATFVMDDTGLTLRTNNQVGPRFKVKMEKGLADRIKSTEDITLSFLIAPRAAFDKANYNYETLLAAANSATGTSAPARIKVADKNKIYEEDDYSWASLVINTSEANRTLDMSVVAYITYYDDKVESRVNRYAATDVEKVRGNLYNVVNTTALSDAVLAKDILENTEFDWYGAGNYPIEISTNAQAEVLKNSGANFSGKVVLANSSVNIPSEIAGNVKTVTEQAVGGNKAEIVLGSGTSYAVDMGTLDGNVVKATIGGKAVSYANGNVTLDFDFKNRLKKHGDQTLTVTVEKDGQYTNYNKEVLIVTKEISSFDELKSALFISKDNVKVKYGYYRLVKDLIGGNWYQPGYDVAKLVSDPESGFRGTFDGNGKKIQEFISQPGIFGHIGKGAVIKNLTIMLRQYSSNFTALGYGMIGANIENVTISASVWQTFDGLSEIPSIASGLLTSLGAYGNTFKNVTINATDVNVDTLFGSGAYGYSYPENAADTYENCTVNVKSLKGLACINNTNKTVTTAVGVNGLTVNVPRDDETATENIIVGQEYRHSLAGVAEITAIKLGNSDFTAYTFADGTLTINADAFGAADTGSKTLVVTAKNKEGYVMNFNLNVTVEFVATPVALEGTREIVLSSGNNFSVDLGDYTNATVLAATLGGETVTYSGGTLTVTDEFKANTQKHGNQTLNVIVQKDGTYYNVTTNVLVVTKEISDIGALTAALTPTEGGSVVYGYYRLAKDLSSGDWYSIGYAAKWSAVQRSNADLGFRGTFDGNGKAITSWFYGDGLFGVVGNGAVIKNLTINNKQYQGGNGNFNTLFGYSMMGATMDKVTINILKGGKADIATNAAGGLLTCLGGYGNTLKNVTINAVGLDIDTLFGTGCWFTYPQGYAPNTFENCKITAKSLIGLACTDNVNKTVTPYENVSGLTVTLGA